jgi:hypothetical protein
VTVAWALTATLWLPWIDAAKSYRTMYQEMKLALPPVMNCMASRNLDESERSMLDYVLGIRTYREEVAPGMSCNVLLVENPLPGRSLDNEGMMLVWSGARPGDTRERFNLYVLNARAQRLVKRRPERHGMGASLG